MANHRPEAIANRFLDLAGDRGLTQLQIQKLVYIAHGWTLALCGEPLTAMEPEAWDRGPVYPSIRDKISHIGSHELTGRIHENDGNPFAVLGNGDRGREIRTDLTDIENQVVNLVWSRYGHLHGFTLSDLTHEPETPWYETYHRRGRNAPIPNRMIEAHYTQIAQNLQGEPAQ